MRVCGRSPTGTGKRPPHGSSPGTGPGAVPRIARLVALAIRIERLIRRGQVRDYAHLPRLGYVTRARITQIMNLLYPAPVDSGGAADSAALRPIDAGSHWSRQQAMWAKAFDAQLQRQLSSAMRLDNSSP